MVAGLAVVCIAGVSRAPKLVAFTDHDERGQDSAMVAAAAAARRSTSPVAYFRPVSAAFRTEPAPAVRKQASSARSMRVAVNRKQASTSHPLVAINAKKSAQPEANAIRLTAFESSPTVFTETVFVVVETSEVPASLPGASAQSNESESAQSAYTIKVWHVVVLRSFVSPNSSRIPAKRT